MSGMAYIAVEDCGCVTAALVDSSEYRKENAEVLGEWIMEGRTIERATVEDARRRLGPCTCDALAPKEDA